MMAFDLPVQRAPSTHLSLMLDELFAALEFECGPGPKAGVRVAPGRTPHMEDNSDARRSAAWRGAARDRARFGVRTIVNSSRPPYARLQGCAGGGETHLCAQGCCGRGSLLPGSFWEVRLSIRERFKFQTHGCSVQFTHPLCAAAVDSTRAIDSGLCTSLAVCTTTIPLTPCL